MDPRALQDVALEVAAARSLDSTLAKVVEGLSSEPGIVLARIWLVQPGEKCETCAMRSDCERQVDCLHLVASAGQSRLDPDVRWDRLDGRFRRFPLNVRKVGMVAGSGEPLLLRIEDPDENWVASPAWFEAEGIQTFAGQPLIFRGEVLGVLAVFHREEITDDWFSWMRTFADQAAVAIANARAFEEVESLREQLELERDYLREEVKVAQRFAGLVGDSPALRRIEEQIEAVAPTDASVLIEGESGTGKELIASAIHDRSQRAAEPIVRVNCASIPRELFESEFFGHAKGSFTGALTERPGRFQVAHGGTLFLDEVGEIPLELQGKLLRVLQEGQYSRVGEDKVRSVDVRIVAATNRDLQAEISAGRFRQDLYYRIGVFPLTVPPLRERPDDIPLLAEHFVRLGTQDCTVDCATLSRRNVRELQAYAWPGNVRELRNVIERALILSRGGRLSFELEPQPSSRTSRASGPERPEIRTDAELRADERANLLAALEATGWTISGASGAAELLGIKPTTLTSRLKSLRIQRP